MIEFQKPHESPVLRSWERWRATLGQVLPFIAPDYLGLLGLTALVVIGASLTALSPFAIRAILDRGILRSDPIALKRAVTALVFISVGEGGISILQNVVASEIGNRVVLRLRLTLFKHLQDLPLDFFVNSESGEVVSRFVYDVAGLSVMVTSVIINVAGNAFGASLVLVGMCVLSWKATVIAVVGSVFFLVPARYLGAAVERNAMQAADCSARLYGTLTERVTVPGASLMKLYSWGDRACEPIIRACNEFKTNQVRGSLQTSMLFSFLTTVSLLATVIIYWFGGKLVLLHQLELGTVVAMAAYITRLYFQVSAVSTTHVAVLTTLVSFERVFEMLNVPKEIRSCNPIWPTVTGEAHIVFKRVCFGYKGEMPEAPGAKMVLENVSFELLPGQTVGLVGRSGAGKSTIASLISRLYLPQSGVIELDGVDIADLDLRYLRSRVGVVTQQAFFFRETVRANLQFAKANASEAEMLESLEVANALEFVSSLPRGLDSLIGEGGYTLSGGERQRLALARIVLRNPSLVILDEATAHLDPLQERDVKESLRRVLKGRTSLVIAHRSASIRDANQILVLDHGRIVQKGSYEALSREIGLFRDCYSKPEANSTVQL